MQSRECALRVRRVLYEQFQAAAREARLTPGEALGAAAGVVAREPWVLAALATADGMPPARPQGDGPPVRTHRRASRDDPAERMIPRILAPVTTEWEWGRFRHLASEQGMPVSSAMTLLVHGIGRGDIGLAVTVEVRGAGRMLITVR
jgi:hypothetical protein